jgi:hypothetical protein
MRLNTAYSPSIREVAITLTDKRDTPYCNRQGVELALGTGFLYREARSDGKLRLRPLGSVTVTIWHSLSVKVGTNFADKRRSRTQPMEFFIINAKNVYSKDNNNSYFSLTLI